MSKTSSPILAVPSRTVTWLSKERLGSCRGYPTVSKVYNRVDGPITLDSMGPDEILRIPITDVLDLHTVSPRDVPMVVEEYLIEANRLNLKALRIIHGRGIGVQREIVRKTLARTPFVASFCDAPAETGGWGATVVDLK